MTSMLLSLRLALITLLALPLWASAGPTFLIASGISLVQNGLTITDLGNGTRRWVTTLTWTNNNAFATNDLYFLQNRQWDSSVSDANAMQWDNAAGVFRHNGNVAEADNEAFYVPLSDTNVGVPPAVFGVDAGDSLPAFLIGALAAGASITTEINFVITSAVTTMFFNGSIVQAVPEAPTLALAVLALTALGASSARRRRG